MAKKEKVVRFKKSGVQDWIDAILWAFVVAMIVRNYTIQNFKIPSSSMENTLLIGDYLVANKMKYFFVDPVRGDIVTFRNPDDPLEPEPRDRYVKILPPLYWNKDTYFFTWHEKKNVVKRVVGEPGDTVMIRDKRVFINGDLYIHGAEIFRDNMIYPIGRVDTSGHSSLGGSRDNMGPFVVPEGKYFVLGDNRDWSYDSRYWGFLDRKDITGTPAMIFFSKSERGHVRWERSFSFIK